MNIKPFVSIGALKFGTSRKKIRQLLGDDYESFIKDDGGNETDAYDELGVHLFYDDEDKLEFVEISEPANPSLQGITFIDRNLDDVVNDLNAIGFDTESFDVGVDCFGAGIALTADDGIVESIGVYRKGYLDK